jgi:hypothetical protein
MSVAKGGAYEINHTQSRRSGPVHGLIGQLRQYSARNNRPEKGERERSRFRAPLIQSLLFHPRGKILLSPEIEDRNRGFAGSR